MSNDFDHLEALGWQDPGPSEDGVRYSTESIRSVSYPDDGFTQLGAHAASGFWFDHRAEIVKRNIEQLGIKRMWEVGAGTGAMAVRLKPPLSSVVAVEPLPAGARAAASLGLASLCGALQDFHLPDGSLQCVGMFDVLEHLEHESLVLTEVRRVLEEDGVVLVTVPALPLVRGEEDDYLGHFRRYTKRSLHKAFQDAGFKLVRTEYFFAALTPVALGTRSIPYRLGRRRGPGEVAKRLGRQLNLSPALDRAVRHVLGVEASLSQRVPLPFGLSLFGAFRKQA